MTCASRAAEAGIVDAQVMLAELMLNGRGGPSDRDAARDLFEKAAAQGDAAAMFALGAIADGERDDATRATAQGWFRQAAERGHPYAQLMFGRYLGRASASETDLAEAERWLKEAEAAGVVEARHELAQMKRRPMASSAAANAA
jgi:hypothetical protein